MEEIVCIYLHVKTEEELLYYFCLPFCRLRIDSFHVVYVVTKNKQIVECVLLDYLFIYLFIYLLLLLFFFFVYIRSVFKYLSCTLSSVPHSVLCYCDALLHLTFSLNDLTYYRADRKYDTAIKPLLNVYSD